MSKGNNLQESQQSRDGIAIGTQGNRAGGMTAGAKGPQNPEQERQDIQIPNQEPYSEGRPGEEEQGRH